jgi:hypothetical protein
VRIDRVEVRGALPHRGQLEAYLVERLWSSEALWRERERFCRMGAAPVRLEGRHDGRTFEIEDLCAGFPFERPILPGLRRFQVNLAPGCPQSCIH